MQQIHTVALVLVMVYCGGCILWGISQIMQILAARRECKRLMNLRWR